MANSTAVGRPDLTVGQGRLDSVDVLRGVAVLGILLMNIVMMGQPDQAYFDPEVMNETTGWNLWVWQVTGLGFEGTMRAIFSLIFGASMLLFIGRDDQKGGISVADAWYRRVIWLFIFGLIHAYVLLWPGDILYSYGLMGMFLFPFRRVAPGKLFALGMALLAAGAVLYLVDNLKVLDMSRQAEAATAAKARGETLSPEQEEAITSWDAKVKELKGTPEEIATEIASVQSGYFAAMKAKADNTNLYRSFYHYRFDYFDVLSMMFIGMALLKWGVLQGARSLRFYAVMVVAGYAIGLLVNWREMEIITRNQFSVTSFYEASVTYDLGRLAMMTGHIALILLLCKTIGMRALQPWAAVGRMALTNYLMHTVITTIVFVVFAQYGKWERYQLYFLVLAIWTFQLITSPIWLKHFYFGPAEWLWRSLTYWSQPAFRRSVNRPAIMTVPDVA
jgi:uncharacterized protein